MHLFLSYFEEKINTLLFSSAGSVYLADLLHGGGRRAGDSSAEQLQAPPSHLQSHRPGLQRRHAPDGGGRPAAQVAAVPLPRRHAGRDRVETLTSRGFRFIL